jgi:repressor LexA
MSIGTRIKELRTGMNLTQEELAKSINVTKGAIANYEKEVSIPKPEIMYKLFSALNCDANYLYQDDIKNLKQDTYSLVEKKLVSDYRKLDDHSKEVVQVVIRKELERNIPNKPTYDNVIPIKKYKVLYYDMPVSAGTGNPLDEEYPEKVDIAEQPPKGTDFIVRVSGDSMEPTYHNGDKLFVKEQPSIEVGDIGIFVVNGNAYVKELGIDKLISHNEKYPDIIINEYITSKCCGKVLGICEEKI